HLALTRVSSISCIAEERPDCAARLDEAVVDVRRIPQRVYKVFSESSEVGSREVVERPLQVGRRLNQLIADILPRRQPARPEKRQLPGFVRETFIEKSVLEYARSIHIEVPRRVDQMLKL